MEIGQETMVVLFASCRTRMLNLQLCASVFDAILCPFDAESVALDQPNKLCIKIDAAEALSMFISSLDQRIMQTVNNSKLTYRSPLRLRRAKKLFYEEFSKKN